MLHALHHGHAPCLSPTGSWLPAHPTAALAVHLTTRAANNQRHSRKHPIHVTPASGLVQRPVCTATAAAPAANAAAGTSSPDTAPSSPSAAVYDWPAEFYTDVDQTLQEYVGPIEVRDIPGKGRGVFTTQAVAPGTLLLVTPPLAMVTGDMGELPELEELVTLMEEWCRWDSWQADWLRSLYRGPPEAGDTAPIPLNNTVPSAAHLPPLGSPTALWASSNATTTGHGSSGSSSGSSSRGSAAAADDAGLAASGVAAGADAGDGLVSLDGTGLDIDEVWRATALNCFGEEAQDLPLGLARQEPLAACLGLWPAFSMINHSCAPGAVNYVAGGAGHMVVRAVRALPPGTEVTINYLGRGSLRPLSQRQGELEASYGFTCGCDRCQLEMAGTTARLVTPQLETLFKRLAEDWAPRYNAAFKATTLVQHEHQQPAEADPSGPAADPLPSTSDGPSSSDGSSSEGSSSGGGRMYAVDREALTALLAELKQAWWQLQQLLVMPLSSSSSGGGSSSSSSSGSPAVQDGSPSLLLQASAYDVLGLMHAICDVLQLEEEDEQVLGDMLSVVEAVAPGSDLHAFQALRWMVVAQVRHGSDSPQDAAAQARLAAALLARYGPQVVQKGSLHAAMANALAQTAGMVDY